MIQLKTRKKIVNSTFNNVKIKETYFNSEQKRRRRECKVIILFTEQVEKFALKNRICTYNFGRNLLNYAKIIYRMSSNTEQVSAEIMKLGERVVRGKHWLDWHGMVIDGVTRCLRRWKW